MKATLNGGPLDGLEVELPVDDPRAGDEFEIADHVCAEHGARPGATYRLEASGSWEFTGTVVRTLEMTPEDWSPGGDEIVPAQAMKVVIWKPKDGAKLPLSAHVRLLVLATGTNIWTVVGFASWRSIKRIVDTLEEAAQDLFGDPPS